MAFPRNSLRAFLQYAKSNLTEALHGDRKINVVIGNESADLDSLTSSLLYAYVKSTQPPTGAFSPIYVPLLNIPASAIRLRPEFTAACNHAGISTSNLLSLDDIKSGFSSPANTRWILVDHNRLQGPLGAQFSPSVQGVIDHHAEENAVPTAIAPEPRILEKVGSCTSLVVRHCRPAWDLISAASLSIGAGHAQGESGVSNDSAFAAGWDAQVAKLALASVLIDTVNLADTTKAEPADREAVRYLEGKIQSSARDAKAWDREKFYEEIDEAKKDIESLEFAEILSKDYKEWTENGEKKLGMSTVVKPLAFLVKKAEEEGVQHAPHSSPPSSTSLSHPFEMAVQAFMTHQDLSLFAIMTAFKSTEGVFTRELFLQAVEPAIGNAKRFVHGQAVELRLEQLSDISVVRCTKMAGDGQPFRDFWRQGDVGKSRKAVAPMLREVLRE